MKGFRRTGKGEVGFTLIELMIVIAVIAILGATAVPAVFNWLPNYRLKKAAMDLHSNFQKAKLAAIKKKCNCAINFNQAVGVTTYDYVVFLDLNNDSVYDVTETVLAQVQLADYRDVRFDTTKGVDGDGIGFIDNGNGNKSISFMPNGLSTNIGGGLAGGTAFLINTNNRTRSVVVSNAGGVSVQD